MCVQQSFRLSTGTPITLHRHAVLTYTRLAYSSLVQGARQTTVHIHVQARHAVKAFADLLCVDLNVIDMLYQTKIAPSMQGTMQ